SVQLLRVVLSFCLCPVVGPKRQETHGGSPRATGVCFLPRCARPGGDARGCPRSADRRCGRVTLWTETRAFSVSHIHGVGGGASGDTSRWRSLRVRYDSPLVVRTWA